ncbi:MAG: DUF3037 domain-containing protein [Chloroflexota bacterium]|nr:MAG: DUF3037 domain-containing protein [Chloroflexota bacterium]
MPTDPFEYTVVRLVPRVERGERINVGVVLFCRTRRFLDARFSLDAGREQAIRALAGDIDLEAIRDHLDVIGRIVRGDPTAGPIGRLADPERFRWVASPSSTIIQPSEVHTGLTDDPVATLDQIFATQVA